MGFPGSSGLWPAASHPRWAGALLSGSEACGPSVTALDVSLPRHARHPHRRQKPFLSSRCPTSPGGGQLSPGTSAELSSPSWLRSSSSDKGHCLSDSRSRRLGSTSTRSQSTWRRQRNSTASSCPHRFLSQVSVYMELSCPAMALGVGAEPALFSWERREGPPDTALRTRSVLFPEGP